MQIKETFNIYVHIVFLYLLPFFYSLIFIIFSRIIWENKLFVLLVYIYIFFIFYTAEETNVKSKIRRSLKRSDVILLLSVIPDYKAKHECGKNSNATINLLSPIYIYIYIEQSLTFAKTFNNVHLNVKKI